MAFLIGGANSLDVDYEVTNSIRWRPAGSAQMSQGNGSPTSSKKMTWSAWVKTAKNFEVDSETTLYSATGTGGNGANITFSNNAFKLQSDSGNSGTDFAVFAGNPARQFTDPSAWYHLVCALDTTQGTAANRNRIYVNGVEQTLLSGQTNATQNDDYDFTSARDSALGKNITSDGNYFDGYMSEIHLVDGQQLTPASFGRTNKNGVWVPKKYTGTFGNNGWYIPGSSNTTDSSPNGNNFGQSNTVITTDTPTNNFCTLNPLTKRPTANGTIAEGNLQYTASTGDSSIYGTIGIPAGMKVYFEVKLISNTAQNAIGIHKLYDGGDGVTVKGGSEAGTWSFKPRGAASVAQYFNNGSATNTSVNNYANNTIVGVALDNANGHIHYHINGTYINNSDPTDNSPPALITGHDETIEQYLHFSLDTTTTQPYNQYNFGNPPFSISSSNADANGYGSFEYAVPSGYYALCTKNLAEFG